MKNKSLLYLLPLLILGASCNILTNPAQNPQSPTSPTDEVPSLFTLPTTIPTTDTEDPCNSEQWHILVTNVIQYPIGDGWKYVIVEFALENKSKYWGSVDASNVILVTEGGFEYEPISGFLKFPTEPATRYSGEHFTSSLGSNSLSMYQKIPPGFVIKGHDATSGGAFKYDEVLNYIFKVAENQQQFTIIGKKFVSCIDENGESLYSSATELILDLNEISNPEFQIIEGRSEAIEPILNNPIELIEAGTLQVHKIERSHPQYFDKDVNAVYLYFTLTNESQGYEVTDSINGYIIGNDGIIRTYGCPQSCDTADGQPGSGWFRVGPGQTTESIYGIPVPLDVKNLMFILEWKRTLQLFDLQQ